MKTRLVPFALLVTLCLATLAHARPPKEEGTRFLGPKPPEKVKRVVTLAPSLTETVMALGAGDTLVGVSRFDEAKEVAHLPRVGGFINPSIETVVGLEPELLLVQPNPGNQRAVETIAGFGVPVLLLPLNTVADTLEALRVVGETLGKRKEAEALVQRIESSRARVREAARGRKAPRVLFVYGFEPLVVAGPGSFADELLRDSGAINVAADARSAYAVISRERAVMKRPDVVVDASDVDVGKDRVAALPVLSEARWVEVPSMALLQPGPSLGRGLEELFELLYPAAKPDAGSGR